MADTKISDLDAAAALGGSEPIPVVQSAATKRTTPDAIRDRAFDSLGSLTAASSLTGTEIVGLNQSGAARRTTAQDIANLAPATPAPALGGLSDVTITSVANGQVLTYDSGTSQWVNATPSGGGGLTHFTESVNTSAPNATIPAVQLLATNAATNVDVALTPKGAGALLAQIPDNTTTGGNKRGADAIDFQKSRSANTHVALGQRSTILNGQNNTTTSNGTNGFIGGGSGGTVSNVNSAVCAGSTCTASGSRSFVGAGNGTTASGADSGAIAGNSCEASGSRAFCGAGTANTASGPNSWIPGGSQAVTRALEGAYAWSGGRRSAQGDNQAFGMSVQQSTSNATPTILTADRVGAGSTNVLVLPNNSCWTGTVHITGRSSGGDVYYLRLDVVGARGANAAATTVKATNPAYTFTDIALVGVSAQVIANTTRGSLEVEVTGLAATTIDWFAHFDAGNQIVR